MSDLHQALKQSFLAAASGDGWWEVPDSLVAHLSASSVGMFMRCPEQWRQRYVRKLKVRPKWTMVLGSANHDTHERSYNLKHAKQQLVSPKEAVDYFCDEAWPRRVDLDGGLDEIQWDHGGKPDTDKALDLGARMVRTYTEQVVPRVEPEFVGEQRFDLWVPGVPVPFVGYTDLIEKDGPVLDIKTTAAKTRTVAGTWQVQARVYNLALKRGVEYHTVPRTKEPTVLTALESPDLLVPYDAGLAALTERQLLQVAVTINHYFSVYGPDDPWPANFMSDACGWCGYKSLCPYWRLA